VQNERFPGSFFGPLTLVELLRHRAQHQPQQTAFVFLVDGENEEAVLSYAELDRRARALAAWLQERDLQAHRALLLYPPGLDFIIGFFGCLYAGVVAVPAYPPRMNRSLDRVQAIAADAEAAVALTTKAVLERVEPMLEQAPDLKNLTWLAADTVPSGHEQYWREPAIRGDTLAFLQYTSGSTGAPKGVMLSHSNLLHNCALIAYAFEHTRSGSGVFWLPNYHDMGLVGGVLQPLWVGRPNVLMSPMAFLQRPVRWLQAITKYRGTTSGGPNFAYDLCVRKVTAEQRARLDLSSWQVAFNGAEPVRAETLDRFVEAFGPCGFRREAFYPCYGLAEATLIVSGGYKTAPPVVRAFDTRSLENGTVMPVAEHERGSRRLVGNGQNLPDQKIRIVDPESHTLCREGEIGEIWVAGPSVALGYWKRREETEHTFRATVRDTAEGPFLRTGDLGFFHDDELFIAGRIKDLIIIRGLNHYPHDIEQTVEQSHPGVRPGYGAAFTVESEEGETRLIIVYELERQQAGELAGVFDAIQKAVARHHELLVDEILLVKTNTVPKTSSGKIQRHACRNAYLDGSLEVIGRWERSAAAPCESVAAAEAAQASRSVPQAAELAAGASLHAPSAAPSALAAECCDAAAAALHDAPGAAPRHNGREAGRAGNRPIAAQVLEEVQRVAHERARGLTLDTNIAELGLDSLERMEILSSIEERFHIRFPEELIPQLETCRDVLRAVEDHLDQPAPRTASGSAAAAPPAEYFRFEQFPEYIKLKKNLELIEASGLGNPYFNVHERLTADTTVIDGRELINFSSYNYVGMSGDPEVARAAKEAIDRYGTSVSASRLVSGEKVLHLELERAIANFVGAEDAVVYVGGHSTNETTVGHLFGPGDLVLHDALAHNSIVQGAILSGARRRPFPHNDWRAVDQILTELRNDYRRVLIAIEGVYSMDGDIPDLPRFIEVRKRHKTFLMVDEAHSIGVLGAHGRGIGEYFDVNPADVDLWMGTLSKAFGSCGGYIAGCKAVVEYLKYTAPGFVYSCGLSPPNAAAALAALRLIESQPERVRRLQENARLFLQLARQRKMNTGLSKDSPVIPIILGDSLAAMRLSRAMARRGINVQPIVYPAVEERAARLRFFITSLHTEQQIRYTIDALTEELAALRGSGSPTPPGVPAALEPATGEVEP
jgi:8-amino-7-oxononanoate synthase